MNNKEQNNLDLLAIFHYVLGGGLALFSCFPFLHVFMGLAMVSGKFFECSKGSDPASLPPVEIGWLFVIMGSIFIILGWTLSVCIIIAGRKLKRRKSRMYCMVIAGFECIFTPIGTVLGIFTLIELNKESVKPVFVDVEKEIF